MEVPLYLWRIWRGCIHFNILSILVILGLPILLLQFAVGRASQKSMAQAYQKLEQKGGRFHHMKWLSIVGFYMLMMFLYDGGRMDFVLCLPFSDRTASWSG